MLVVNTDTIYVLILLNRIYFLSFKGNWLMNIAKNSQQNMEEENESFLSYYFHTYCIETNIAINLLDKNRLTLAINVTI